MLTNYLKVAIRTLFKNKTFVVINVFGLGLALACCIVAYLNTRFDQEFDQNHQNIDHIFKVHSVRENQGEKIEYGTSPMPLAPAISDDITGVRHAFRFAMHTFTVREENKNKSLHTSVCFVDEGFMESFTFPTVYGDAKGYDQLGQVVLSKTYASKFFDEHNPTGRTLTIFDDNGRSFGFVVSGVVEDAPPNSSIHFDLLLNFENRFRMYEDNTRGNWGALTGNTFLFLDDPNRSGEIADMLGRYIPVQNSVRPDRKIVQFILSPMNNHAHIADYIRSEGLPESLHPAAVLTPQIMAVLILLIACFNFTNTAIASSNSRLREIGVRKVMGGDRRQLMIQFMMENLIVCFLAVLLSVGIGSILVPAYSALWGGMNLQMDFSRDFGLYLFLTGLLVLSTILAGFYPSLYISKYEPVKILRGKLNIGGANWLSRSLLTAQYTFTVIALFASLAFIQNAQYQEDLDLGFNVDQIIGVRILNDNQYQKIYQSMTGNPWFQNVAGTRNHVRGGDYRRTLINQDAELEVRMVDFGQNYLETMDLQIKEGRGFSKESESADIHSSLVVNERLVELFGWTDAIGKRLTMNDTTTLTVIGVVENYYMNGFWGEIPPMGMRLANDNFNFVVGKVESEHVGEAFAYLEAQWNEKIPTQSFTGFYQDDLFREAKEVNSNIAITFSFLGVVAVILSCLGLFTLVSLNIIKRVKEIGVRKVLGGSVIHIIKLINFKFFVLLGISSILGLTLGYYLIDALIASIFNYYKEVDLVTFMVPAIVIIGLSLLISSLRTLQTALVNPVETLRYE